MANPRYIMLPRIDLIAIPYCVIVLHAMNIGAFVAMSDFTLRAVLSRASLDKMIAMKFNIQIKTWLQKTVPCVPAPLFGLILLLLTASGVFVGDAALGSLADTLCQTSGNGILGECIVFKHSEHSKLECG